MKWLRDRLKFLRNLARGIRWAVPAIIREPRRWRELDSRREWVSVATMAAELKAPESLVYELVGLGLALHETIHVADGFDVEMVERGSVLAGIKAVKRHAKSKRAAAESDGSES